ncbi:alanine--tRNA ligase [Nevskia sp.]|uniref:alanine--tRNA ligase n=1 Tax=Nevskia sp. TaxID=1929292 RepID=UPI0025EC2BF3|nr:alanine--tRNA ligase [Nevskia sp.]
MNSNELRARFLEYFRQQGHAVVPSSSLVPGNDPTLLFTNSGMVQFKDVFTGQDKRPYTRATSSQRCVRAGGKHNDLENVGYTARHHTFFEMLGNFSFGDYFKQDAIRFAWEFITGANWLAIDKNRLLVTVYHTDDEAYSIWHEQMGIPADRIVRIGDNKGAPYASDNFWAMGDTGPCGPCTEIFYDHDPDGSKGIYGGPPGSPEEDGDRWIEIWNVVFMQFERSKDGQLTKLPAPSVDTGMGLERISALMQGTNDNYQIDTFKTLVSAVAKLSNTAPYASASQKVVADHIRSAAFLIIDGVVPGNEGRGYVLRRVMRRAIRHGYKLGLNEAFFWKLVGPLAEAMGGAYPELIEQRARIEQVIRAEEDSFASTLDKGMKLLDEAIGNLASDTIPGEVVFKLYDTYGFPFDLTADIARERSLKLDEAGYEREMEAQRTRARAASKFTAGEGLKYEGTATEFHGYEHLQVEGATVVALYRGSVAVDALKAGDEGAVVLDKTPFYAESGGQAGDAGSIGGFAVVDTQKIKGGAFAHVGKLESGTLTVGATVAAAVASSQRRATVRNHSATHLMHKALREVLGPHVQQKGSLVDADKTRFDFAHTGPMTAAEVAEVERIVNAEILANAATQARVLPIEEAKKTGAMMLFGEKYGDEVRVLDIGTSRELCGGTHVARTGDIGLFKIVSESGVAAGIRRVEAVTGDNALAYVNDLQARLNAAAGLLRVPPSEVGTRIVAVLDGQKALEKELAQLKSRLAASAGDELAGQAKLVHGVKVLSTIVEGVDGGELRGLLDQLKNKLGSGVVLLGVAAGGKVSLIAGVTADLTARVKAGELLAFAAAQVGGKGGGRPDMAQGGGTQPENLPAAIASALGWIEQKLAS